MYVRTLSSLLAYRTGVPETTTQFFFRVGYVIPWGLGNRGRSLVWPSRTVGCGVRRYGHRWLTAVMYCSMHGRILLVLLHRTLWLNLAIPNHSCDRVHRSTVFFKESEHSVKDERSNFLLVRLLPSILHGSCACKAAMLSRAQGSYKQPKLWALGHINYWA